MNFCINERIILVLQLYLCLTDIKLRSSSWPSVMCECVCFLWLICYHFSWTTVWLRKALTSYWSSLMTHSLKPRLKISIILQYRKDKFSNPSIRLTPARVLKQWTAQFFDITEEVSIVSHISYERFVWFMSHAIIVAQSNLFLFYKLVLKASATKFWPQMMLQDKKKEQTC